MHGQWDICILLDKDLQLNEVPDGAKIQVHMAE